MKKMKKIASIFRGFLVNQADKFERRIMSAMTVVWLMGIPGILSAQHVLQSDLNLPRSGDAIIKQQVEYKDPGRSGENVIWNFGQLQSVNDEYSLVYSEPLLVGDSIYIMGNKIYRVADYSDASLFIGTEHRTRYYYLFQDSLLWTLGHENAATVLRYTQPLLSGVFPLNYGGTYADNYTAQGIYSGSIPFENAGNVRIEADAYGMMVLPSGDTLRHVMRTQSIRHFSEILPTTVGDSVTLNTLQENYQWYSQGYRYPIFETIRTVFMEDSTEIDRFETAFFYPPQEHYYLDDDEENLAILENEGNENNVDPWEGLSYNIFPNQVKTFLDVEIYLPRPANVRVQLRSTMGNLVLNEDKGHYPIGICSFRFDAWSFPLGNYILDIWLDDHLVSGIIMKR
jgi:hypothetical protein